MYVTTDRLTMKRNHSFSFLLKLLSNYAELQLNAKAKQKVHRNKA